MHHIFVAEPPPKRDFLKENVLKIKNASKFSLGSKDSGLQSLSKTSSKSSADGLNTQKNFKSNLKKNPTSKFSASSDNISRSTSQASHLVDTAVQTVDVNGDRFLDNAIIRYPSTHILKSLSTIACTCSDYNYSENGSLNPENSNGQFLTEDIGDGDSNRKNFIDNLREFRDTGTISKKKSPPPFEGYRGPRASQSVRSELNQDTLSQNNFRDTASSDRHSINSQFHQPPQTACSLHSQPPSEPIPQTACSIHSNMISPASIQSHDTQSTKSSKINKNEVPSRGFIFYIKFY